jgi:hypothetical protein
VLPSIADAMYLSMASHRRLHRIVGKMGVKGNVEHSVTKGAGGAWSKVLSMRPMASPCFIGQSYAEAGKIEQVTRQRTH